MVGWKRNIQNTDPAATDTPIVDEKIVRKKPIPFNFSLAMIAKNKPIRTVVGTVYKTNRKVDCKLFWKIGDVKILIKLSKPTNTVGVPLVSVRKKLR